MPKPELAISPGGIAAPAGARASRVRVILYDAEGFDERHIEDVAALHGLRSRVSGVLWVDIEGVGDASTFEALADLFGLHPLAMEDVVQAQERPKAEDYDDHAYVVLHMPARSEPVSLEQVSIFLGSNYVITIQEGLPGDCLEPLRHRIRTARGRVRRRGADYLAYAVMDTIVDSYFPVVERLNTKLEDVEERVVELLGQDVVTEIHAIRHEVHTLRRTLASSREAVGILLRGETGTFSDSTLPFLRDCHDHMTQLLDAVDAMREVIAGLMDLHLAGTNFRMNEVMKMLTVIATIFMPLSFIAGVYGMNFDRNASPWNMPELGWRFGYPFALGLMSLTGAMLVFYFWHRGWFGRRRASFGTTTTSPRDITAHDQSHREQSRRGGD